MGVIIGKLDRRIVLETNTPSQDTYGDPIESWSTLDTVWAEKLTANAFEKFTGEKLAGFRRIAWMIRHRTDVDNLARVVYNSENYEVLGVTEVGRKKGLIITTEAVIN